MTSHSKCADRKLQLSGTTVPRTNLKSIKVRMSPTCHKALRRNARNSAQSFETRPSRVAQVESAAQSIWSSKSEELLRDIILKAWLFGVLSLLYRTK
nr:hypothetical protein CFP56_24387 [Quercus suber]